MSPVTETEMKELRDLVLGLREEIRLGFAESKADTDAKFAEAYSRKKNFFIINSLVFDSAVTTPMILQITRSLDDRPSG
jgi:hypothetical protein